MGKLAKNPLADPFGLLNEGKARIGNKIAPGSVGGVHPSLSKYGDKLRKHTVQFGEAVEALLIKHGKDVVQEQLMLKVRDQILNMSCSFSKSGTIGTIGICIFQATSW